MKTILWGPWQLMAYLTASVILFASYAESDTYAQFKYKTNLESGKTSNYLRLGYAFENNFYVESGDGSAELGYKKKLLPNLVVKGKIESTNDFEKNGAEIKIKYTFAD